MSKKKGRKKMEKITDSRPWSVCEDTSLGGGPVYWIYDKNGLELAEVFEDEGYNVKTLASLIAAAPEMLNTLKAIHNYAQSFDGAGMADRIVAMAEEAIQKAEGAGDV